MHKLIYILLFLASITATSQSYSLEKINEVTLDTDTFIAVDAFNALYHIKGDILYKTDVQNEYQFSALQLGALTSVDVLNPLRITLFYESSNTAVILDNTLNEITRVNFSTIENFRNVSHVRTASDRRFWIFNTDLQQLEIFDWNTQKVLTQFPPMAHNATALMSNFNFAWVSTKDGVFYYNNYGSFIEKIESPESQLMSQDKGVFILYADKRLYYKPNDTAAVGVIETLDLSIKQLSLKGESLYIYSDKKLTAFRLKLAKQP